MVYLDRFLMILVRADQGLTRLTMLRSSIDTNAFLVERDVYREIQYVRDDFSLLTSVVAEAYGPNFFS